MSELYFNWVVEDIVPFVKAIVILGEKDTKIPLIINGTGIYSTIEVPPKKKKKKNGGDYPLIFRLKLPRYNLPKFTMYSKTGKKSQLIIKKNPQLIIGLDKIKIVEKMASLKNKESVTIYTKPQNDSIYYSIDGSDEKFNSIVDLNYEPVVLPKIKFSPNHPNACITKEDFQKLCANIKRYKNADLIISIHENGIIIKCSEYGTENTAEFVYGIIADEIDSMKIDSDGFMLSTGNIDKMCNMKSIIKFYGDRDENGRGYFMISLPIGSSGFFEIYCPVIDE